MLSILLQQATDSAAHCSIYATSVLINKYLMLATCASYKATVLTML